MKISLWWGITCLRWCLSPLSVILIKYIKIYEALLHSQTCWEARKLVQKLTQVCLSFWAFPSVTSFFQAVSFSCLRCQALFFNHLFFLLYHRPLFWWAEIVTLGLPVLSRRMICIDWQITALHCVTGAAAQRYRSWGKSKMPIDHFGLCIRGTPVNCSLYLETSPGVLAPWVLTTSASCCWQ